MRPAAVALLLLTLPLWACTSDDDTPSPHSTTTTLSAEAQVEAAYLAYWDMAARLSAAPDPASTEIGERSVDPVRSRFVESLEALETAGQVVETGPEHVHDVSDVVLAGNTAELQDCGVDDSVVVESATGTVLLERLTTTLLEADLVREGDTWRVSEIREVQSWEGVAPCSG